MPRATPPFELPLVVPRGRPRAVAICEALRAAILEGRLRSGERLPSTRALSRQLRVARGTIVEAYEQLVVEGYVEGARGAGTYVADVLPERFTHPQPAAPSKIGARRAPSLSKRGRALATSPFPLRLGNPLKPFRPHTAAVDLFPHATWNRLAARRVRRGRAPSLRDGDARGLLRLREALASRLRVVRGVEASPEQVIIVGSAQQALDVTARIVLDPGDAAWLEEPGYMGARTVFAAAGARIAPIAVDADGLRVEEGIARAPNAKLVYVTPARQLPLGAMMPIERRLLLLEWASRRGAWVFEDDYDSEFRFEGRPLPAMQSLDRAGVVVHCGTFSKTMLSALRLAYVVVPPKMVEPFTAALSIVARYTPLALQEPLADFIAEGHLDRHVRRMRRIYAERRDALIDALEAELGDAIDIVGASAGLELLVRLPRGVDDVAVVREARALQLEMLPLSHYCTKRPSRGGLVLGFAGVPPRAMRAAVARLKTAISASSRRSTRP